MNLIKEHHHTLLVTLFLIGALFVAGSFEARVPDSAIAATTPGSQSVQKNAVWNFNYGQPDSYDTSAMTQVNYAGEVRDKNTGALIASDTKLKPGDKVTLDIFANASYFVTGAWNDSPPALWGANPVSNLLPSPWVYRGFFAGGGTTCASGYSNCYTLNNLYAYEYREYPYNVVFPSAPANYCLSGHLTGITNNIPFCLINSLQNPTITLNTGGMNCGALSASDAGEGARKYSTTCTITTSGPQATLATNIDATSFYYPARVRELASAPGTANQESIVSGYEPSSHSHGTDSEDEPTLDFIEEPGLTNFYRAGTIAAAALSWNIDVAPEPPPAAPTLTFTGNPTTINQGQSFTLNWNSQNTTSCSAPDLATAEMAYWTGSKPTSGSQNVAPLNPGTYAHSLTCTGPGGDVSSSVTITVIPTLSASCSVSPTAINAGGSATWTASASGGTGSYSYSWSGTDGLSGTSQSVTKTYTTTGTKSGSVTVTSGSQSATQACSNSVTVGGGFSCNAQNQCVFGGGGASCLTNAGCPGGGGGGGCVGNCGGGGGGGGGGSAPIASSPSASALGSDTSFFCPSHQVQLSWSYSDPNNDSQAAFRLQLDDSPSFNSMLIDAYKDTADHLYVTPANVLAFGTKYYFRVAVKDSTGAWSDWSSSANFTTPANCLVPDFSLNSSNSISVNVTGVGSGTSNTTQITITPFDQFSSLVTLSFNSVSPALSGAVYSFVPANLPQNKYSSGSTFKVTVPGNTAPGNYVVTIKGEGGNPTLTRTVNVNLKVNSTSPEFKEI